MEQTDIAPLSAVYLRQLADTKVDFKRYLYNEIDWNARLIGIRGARGVGKTTLLLQYIKERIDDKSKAFWVSLDNLWFKSHSLAELVEYLNTHGVTYIFFDEVHKCDNWATLLKNFYDSYPDLRIVYTGSSMLEIDNSRADLSRRQDLYTMTNMSFREYLKLCNILDYNPIELNDLLKNHFRISFDISAETKVLKYFGEYLKNGCYPFFRESANGFPMRLNTVIQTVIESDMPAVADISYSTVEKIKKLLMIVANNVPFEVNISKLAKSLEATRDSTLRMLYTLDRANIVSLLSKDTKSYKRMSAPEKVFLNNPNLMFALSDRVDVGNMRESFFLNQLQAVADVKAPKSGDFIVNGQYLFEVGGQNKRFDQIKDIPDSYLAVDNIETGFGNRIPLWMFGFLY